MPEDLPIALRRSRRSAVARVPHGRPTQTHQVPQTPSREKKRVRFSDPGPSGDAVAESDGAFSSTGLTPFMRRTQLSAGSEGRKRRRHSGPAALSYHDVFTPDRETGYSGQVTFLPMRQVLDGRVKRRIRRNGLSEEMHVISAEKKRRALQTKAEMDDLRAAVAAKDAEIRRLSGATEVADEDDESIDDLKRQVEQLRRALKSPAPSSTHDDSGLSDNTQVDWNATAGHQSSDDCLEMDIDFGDDGDHFFDDSTIAELACSTPTRRRADIRNSFPTPPSTSPIMRLVTPPMRQLFTPTSHASVQVQVPDEERREVEEEFASLQLEIEKLTDTLETYEAMTCRLSDKLAPFAPEGGSAAEAILGSRSPTVKVEAQLNKLLEVFKDRTALLAKVSTSLGNLGFRGNDASEIIASLATAFRSARLELEYLDPGESTLPLSASGAAILDLLLTRLRELAREKLEHADTIDEYQAVEVSLRKQLGARVEAMDDMRQEISTLKGKVKLRNVRIQELEAGMDRLRGSVKSYTSDIAELEKLAQRLEGDLDAANKDLQESKEVHQADEEERVDALEEKDSAISLLETKLGLALEETAALREQLTSLQRQHDELQTKHEGDLSTLNQQHGSSLALRDTRIFELRTEVDKVNKALYEAYETTRQLRLENGSLETRLDAEKVKTKAVLETMRSEFERVVRMGETLMSTPPKSPSEV